MANDPYGKLIPKLLERARKLEARAAKKWAINIWGIEACWEALGKLESDLRNVWTYLDFAGSDVKANIRARFRGELSQTVEAINNTRSILERKGGFLDFVGRLNGAIKILDKILSVVGLGGFVQKLLPASRS